MATGGNDFSSDENFNIICSFFAKKNKTMEAAKYNLEYQDVSLHSFPTEPCPQHLFEVVSMFCRDHNEVACPLCMTFDHRSCTNIHSIAEEVDSLHNTTQLSNTKQRILTAQKTMEDMKTAKENQMKQLKKAFDQEVKSVKAFRQELQTLLDSLEQESIRELKTEFDRIELSMKGEITEVNKILDAMITAASQLRKSEGNKAQEFISVKYAEKVAAKVEDVEKEQLKKTEENISFTAHQSIKEFLKQIYTLGKVSSNTIQEQQKQTFGTVSSNTQVLHSKKEGLYKVKQQTEVDIKLITDHYECNIYGSCITKDGYVLLADFWNNKLKRFDLSTNKVKDDIEFHASPYAVCLFSDRGAVVTLNNNTIQFVFLASYLTATHSFKMTHKCYGLAYNESKLFVSDFNNSVYIYDMSGQKLMRTSIDSSGNALFKTPSQITVSAGEDRVFVADQYRNTGVVILDIQGNYLSTLTDPTLSGSHGLCTDGSNLFVCGFNSGNIVQIGENNNMLGELAKVKDPLSLCFDHHNSRMIVTHHISNNITVLDLE